MVCSYTKLSRKVCNNVNLALHLPKRKERNTRGRITPLSRQSIDEWMHRCLVTILSHRTFKVMFEIALPRTCTELRRLHSTICTELLEQIGHLGAPIGSTSSCRAWCCGPLTRPPMLHLVVATVVATQGEATKRNNNTAVACYLSRWSKSRCNVMSTSPSGRRYHDDESATTVN